MAAIIRPSPSVASLLRTQYAPFKVARTAAYIAQRAGPSVEQTRSYGTRQLPAPVDLAFDVIEPKDVRIADQSMVICHGLFGSKQNWRSLAKAFAQKLGMNVYTLDMRNHGVSPHVKPHNYDAMAADIALFVEKQGLKNVNLLGHSMGGKAVMAYALNSDLNGPLRSLMSVDMTPAIGKVSPEFEAYTDNMLEIEHAKVANRHDADKILHKVEKNKSTRQFLLTNMVSDQDESGKSFLRFRLPVQLLKEEVPSIGEFPYTPPPPVSATSPQWMGPVLVLKGAQSKYVNRRNIPICEAFFPNCRVEILDAGHWVHAEKPAETVELVGQFILDGK